MAGQGFDPSAAANDKYVKAIPHALLETFKDFAGPIVSAAKLPGDVATGKTDPLSPEAIGRSTDLAGLIAGGDLAARKGAIKPLETAGKTDLPAATGVKAEPAPLQLPGAVKEPTPAGSAIEPPAATPGLPQGPQKITPREPQAGGAGDQKYSLRRKRHPHDLREGARYYEIIGKDGKPAGYIDGIINTHQDSSNFKVNFIRAKSTRTQRAAAREKGSPGYGSANVLGPTIVRDLYKQIKADNPSIKTISGTRISGARAKIVGSEREAKVTLPQSAGAAATPTHEILKGTIQDNEKLLAKQPGIVDGLKKGATAIRSVLAPETVDSSAARAASSIRSSIGRVTRDSEKTAAALDGFQKQVNTYSPEEKLSIIDWIQQPGAKTARGYEPAPEVKPLLQTIHQTFEARQAKLAAAPSTEKMRFIEDYYPQMWKNPEKAKQFAGQFGIKEGSGGFTKARAIPTVADGIRAGLEPVTIDPIEGTLRYVENVDRFLATNEVFDTAVDHGDVLWRTPGEQPEGWTEVQGRKNQPVTGQRPYAPPGWAQVYNNFISRPPQGAWGDILKGAQSAANSVSALKLALSGFHATMMTQEAVVSGVAKGVMEAARGRPLAAIKSLGSAPFKPITSVLTARRLVKAYLHDIGDPEVRKVAELAADANFRVVGKGKVADEYRFGARNLVTSWRKGLLRAEMAATGKDIAARPVAGAFKAFASGVRRTLETIASPLFDIYIPTVKNAAYFDGLSRWLKDNPTASRAEQVAYAQKFADNIDNRFGEMNQDNIFWNKTQKQVAQLGLLSYSYTIGTLREIGGGLIDTAKAPYRLARGEHPVTDKMAYTLVALPLVYGAINAMYQYMHTGELPKDFHDLVAPRTGGVDATTGQPERAALPSYMNSVFGFLHDPVQEMENKANPSLDIVHGLLTGKDWRGDPIYSSTDDALTAGRKLFEFIGQGYEPISVENQTKRGSAISGGERFMGARPAPMWMTDPNGYAKMKASQGKKADKLKARHDATQQRNYGGTQ